MFIRVELDTSVSFINLHTVIKAIVNDSEDTVVLFFPDGRKEQYTGKNAEAIIHTIKEERY